MIKNTAYFLLFICLFQLTGCETVQRKFTPKKKVPKHVPSTIYFQEGPYQKKFSNDYYYKTRFTLWRTWQDELIDQLGGNNKKVGRCAQEAVSNLEQMKQYLKPARQAELSAIIGDLTAVIERIDQDTSKSQSGAHKVELERIRRAVNNDFYYDKIKEDLVSDKVDLGQPGVDITGDVI